MVPVTDRARADNSSDHRPLAIFDCAFYVYYREHRERIVKTTHCRGPYETNTHHHHHPYANRTGEKLSRADHTPRADRRIAAAVFDHGNTRN